LQEYLSRWGLDVTTVGTATEAIDQITTAVATGSPYRIILLDRLMPDIDGLRLARMIRSHSELGDPKLIMLTSLDETVPAEELQNLELTCLQKPLRQSRLFDAVIMAVESDDHSGTTPSDNAQVATPPLTDKRRVLIVDDNEVNRMVAGEILRAVGYETTEARNGRRAIEIVETERFDAVLMDCEMPEMDGFEATRHIRMSEKANKLPHLKSRPLPIIALTAQAIQGDRQRCLSAGMTEYITKPVQRDALLQLLGQCLGEQPRQEIPVTAVRPEPWRSSCQSDRVHDIAFEELLARCGGAHDAVMRILEMFQTRSAQRSCELSTAIENGDLEQTRRLAHAFKGSAANVSAARVSDVAGQIETAAGQGRHETCRELYSRMSDALDCCQTEISRLLSGEV
jgi:CheY-like chemotaxis protein/HPt (histidine-containing phosphotransfer) domain-containing protein